LAGGVVAVLLLTVPGVVVGVGLVGALGGRRVALVLGLAGGRVGTGVAVHAVRARVVGHGLRLVDGGRLGGVGPGRAVRREHVVAVVVVFVRGGAVLAVGAMGVVRVCVTVLGRFRFGGLVLVRVVRLVVRLAAAAPAAVLTGALERPAGL